jgi:hypothetical protein
LAAAVAEPSALAVVAVRRRPGVLLAAGGGVLALAGIVLVLRRRRHSAAPAPLALPAAPEPAAPVAALAHPDEDAEPVDDAAGPASVLDAPASESASEPPAESADEPAADSPTDGT